LPRSESRESVVPMTNAVAAQEQIGFRRADAVPGLDIIDAQRSPRQWRDVGGGFAVTFLRTWHGSVYYRGRLHEVQPGVAFCNHPAEALVATPHQGTAGSFNVLVIAPELLREWLSEYQSQTLRPQWRAVAQPISSGLGGRFREFLGAFQPDASALELQSAAAELSEEMIRELVSGSSETLTTTANSALRGVARMRECLHDQDFEADLASLAREAGLSRFQALRAFKRRYGLPPHAYQLCLRVARARALLLDGAAPADVAAHCGFVDQSHFNRHFKRIVGVTPTQFAASKTATVSGVYRIFP
jgi:AraC-like DNA-binding protein